MSEMPQGANNLVFQSNSPPKEVELPFAYFFNTPGFVRANHASGVTQFLALLDNHVVGCMNVAHSDGESFSLPLGSFGSVQFLPGQTEQSIGDFVDYVLNELKSEGVGALTIKHWPQCYNVSQWAHIDLAFRGLGFSVHAEDINQHIAVVAAEFKEIIKPSKVTRLNKCYRAGFKFEHLTPDRLTETHQLVATNRERKGFPLTMSQPQLEKAFLDFPNRYKLFGVLDKNKIIATVVGVLISPKILYTFLPADDTAYSSFSPTIMLYEGLYSYCQSQEISMLDLGISTDRSKLNEGLYKFKERLGAIASPKLTYRITF